MAVAIEPGHDGWVVGSEPAVMIEFDFEGDTIQRRGVPAEHSHRVGPDGRKKPKSDSQWSRTATIRWQTDILVPERGMSIDKALHEAKTLFVVDNFEYNIA
jgi:hypothetical protein